MRPKTAAASFSLSFFLGVMVCVCVCILGEATGTNQISGTNLNPNLAIISLLYGVIVNIKGQLGLINLSRQLVAAYAISFKISLC